MRSIESWLNRFCHKHPRFGIPNLMNIIVIGSVLVYLLDMFSQNSFSSMLYFSLPHILHGQVWRLITFVFMPLDNSLVYFVLSTYLYWMIGTTLEREWGTTKFTLFYVMGVVLNILLGLILGYATITYVNLSMFFAFATLYPETRFYILFFIPVKVKWLAWIDAAIFAWSVIRYLIGGHFLYALIPIIAILNYFLFFSADFARLFGRVKHKTSKQTINFKKAQKQARQTKGYIHKCAVCGITDEMDSTMEFRYCSKCNGYYCYCMNHINNHVHIE